MFAHRLER